MSFKSFLGNWIVKNILWAIVFIGGLSLVISILLSVITQHNSEITVPDMVNLTYAEACNVAEAAGVRVQFADSVFVPGMKKGAVVNQSPKGGERVKKGRRVSLTVNSTVSKKVKMPNLQDQNLRQAKAELAARGLVLSRLKYESNIATNYVIKALYRGAEIAPGKELPAGSNITLVMGLNSDDCRTYIPNVKGMKFIPAKDAIHSASLNVGTIKFDDTVRNYSDSLNAFVYSQHPSSSGLPMVMGSEVAIYLTLDSSKLQ